MAHPSLPASASVVLSDGPVTFGPYWLWEKEEGHFCSFPSAFLGDVVGRVREAPEKVVSGQGSGFLVVACHLFLQVYTLYSDKKYPEACLCTCLY